MATGTVETHKRPDIKWGESEEELLAKWADKATCYRWMHDKAEKMYTRLNMYVTIPVIVLSTLTGTANFGLSSMVPSDLQNYAQLGIGGVSLVTGIISTIANYLRYAQGMEAHRGAAISWGKLYRKISIELSLPRKQRENVMDFLLVCRSELDRLIEQSPSIPDKIISEFCKAFPNVELSAPVKWNDLEKTLAYVPKATIVTIRETEEAADNTDEDKMSTVAEKLEYTVNTNAKAPLQKLKHLKNAQKNNRVKSLFPNNDNLTVDIPTTNNVPQEESPILSNTQHI